MVYCTALREIDAVLGTDGKLVDKLAHAARELSPKFIAVLGSPVPMVVGTDMQGVAAEIEQVTGIPAIGFDTTGLDYYDKGVGDAFLKLAKRFVEKTDNRADRAINLLGATPLDFGVNGDITTCRKFFEDADYSVISDWSMHSTLDDISRSGEAVANVVLSPSGLTLARHFYEEFGTPYVCGVPIGEKASATLLAHLELAVKAGKPQLPAQPFSEKSDTLIIHNQIVGNSLRNFLVEDIGKSGTDVATVFAFQPELAAPGDTHPIGERSIAKIINSGYSTVIADPLLKQLIMRESDINFIPLPHIAVSSNLHWHNIPNIIGEGVHGLLEGAF
jgi:hypothetical protein